MLLSAWFSGTQSYAIGSEALVVFQNDAIEATIPKRPLAEGSVKISPARGVGKSFLKWSLNERKQTWDCLQRIIYAWRAKNPCVSDFLVYGKATQSSAFAWEIIPYPQRTWSAWRQLCVLWRITFGAPTAADRKRRETAKTLVETLLPSCQQLPSIIIESERGTDPFCCQEVVNRQTVFQGKQIHVLYNFAPIRLGGEDLHFLLVPKAHRFGFGEVTQAEHLECQILAGRIVQFYQSRGYPTAYLFDKTGKRAGQTVSHWHQHLVFTKTRADDWKGKWSVFCRMLFGASPLKPQELQKRVSQLRSDLQNFLTQQDT